MTEVNRRVSLVILTGYFTPNFILRHGRTIMKLHKKKLRCAFIGCGNIAPFHADVIKHLGHSISVVVGRKNSTRLEIFAREYGVAMAFYGVDNFLKDSQTI